MDGNTKSVSKRICQDGKQTNIQPQGIQRNYGSSQGMPVSFLFVFEHKKSQDSLKFRNGEKYYIFF